MEKKVYSVSEVNRYIKMVFDKDTFLNSVNIRGEITNFKAHYTGHLYFTLKDDTSTVKCVMFKGYADALKFKLNDGAKVVISGQVSVFERDGSYQVYCKNVTPEGLGELYLAYEQLKAKLEKEGLFDPFSKKKIPFMPKRVGVITSKTGAVIKDIINVTTRRYDKVNLLIYPAAVQGVNVAQTVIKGIQTFNKLNNVDVIIIARGGGSFEDLFGFNDENLARQIFSSRIPIISAVGHETDFTICDFVSDLRAPTPSAAAELVYPQYLDIVRNILNNKNRIMIAIKNYIERKKQYVERVKASKLEKKPLDIIRDHRMTIDKILKSSKNIIDIKVEKSKSKYMQLVSKVDALSPLKTLSRGYSVVQSMSGHVITKKADTKANDELVVTVSDGKINVVVK
ncbi:MAG: exodeoxyribonuclease VII large subunit [Clostridia bacterium]|nr:exodeoxyribonuclease VII large subunit [Clostridia bacterium]